MSERELHLETLRELLACSELNEIERAVFADMLSCLEEGQYQLTFLQARWAQERHEELLLGDPAKRNANVPRGKEVPVPEVLKALPKSPPRRR
jgi:hypothetical protein